MTYEPTFRNQFADPTTGPFLDARNCAYQAGAMLLDWQTLGRIQEWGGELWKRAKDDDPANGGNLWDIERAWVTYGEDLDIRTFKSDGTFDGALSYLTRGYAVEFGGSYKYIPADERCQENANIGHAFCVLPVSKPTASGRQWKVGDPLCKSWNFIPEKYLRAYAEGLGRENGIRTVDGKQGIFYARALRKDVPEEAFVRVLPGPFREYDVNDAGYITDRHLRFTAGFSATCTPVSKHYWPGHGEYWIVQLKSGSRRGMWIGGAGPNFIYSP